MVEELNGLGKRVNLMEQYNARHDEQIKHLEREFKEQRKDVWRAIGLLREQGTQLIIKLSVIFGGIVAAGFATTIVIQLFLN